MKIPTASRRRTPAGLSTGKARPFLEENTTVRVRFNEVDSLRIVWHGHYANYFEEARRGFGRRYGIDYPTFIAHGVAVPVIHLCADYFAPARLADLLIVTARLLKSDSARLDFEYEIRREGEPTLLATGATSQVFTTFDGKLLLTWPDLMLERLKTWEPLWNQPAAGTAGDNQQT